MTIPQAGHPLFVWQKSEQILEHRSFVLKRRNTDEHYGGYSLLRNTDCNRKNIQAKDEVKRKVYLVLLCFFAVPSCLKRYFAR